LEAETICKADEINYDGRINVQVLENKINLYLTRLKNRSEIKAAF
jgi:hypothetical protein